MAGTFQAEVLVFQAVLADELVQAKTGDRSKGPRRDLYSHELVFFRHPNALSLNVRVLHTLRFVVRVRDIVTD